MILDAALRGGDLSGTPRLGGEVGPAVKEAVGTVGGEEAPMIDLVAHAYRVGVSDASNRESGCIILLLLGTLGR